MTQDSIDIVCLKHGEVYDWSWVDKLYRGALRSFSKEINFHVLTDRIDQTQPYNQILLPEFSDLKAYEKNSGAWWYKLWLFSDQHPLQRQFVYLDLDMIFTGNCDFLLDCPEDKFGGILEWQLALSPRSRFMINSSLMVMNPRHHHYIWQKYNENRPWAQENHHGDQDFVAAVIDRSTVYFFDNKNKVVSYAYSVLHGGVKSMQSRFLTRFKCMAKLEYHCPEVPYILPQDARLVVCNGYKYKPNLLTDLEFIQQYWV